MLSDDKYDVELTEDYCNIWFPAGRNVFYRLVKCIHICLASISIFLIVFFLVKFKNLLSFHFNVKILFYFHLLACFLQAAVLGVFQTHHLVTSLLASFPCDVVLPKIIYASFNIPMVFSMMCIESSIIGMVFERTLASFLFQCYEKSTKIIGFVFLGIVLLVPTLLTIYIYHNDTFDTPHMVAMSTSPSSSAKINELFVINIISLIIALIHTIALYKHNQRRNTISFGGNLQLSSRYQLAENVTTARLLYWITTAQLLIYITYAVLMYAVRTTLPAVKDVFWQCVIELLYTPPLYCALMPILCITTIQKSNKERNSKISLMLQVRSTGKEGWDNYQNMLEKQWA